MAVESSKQDPTNPEHVKVRKVLIESMLDSGWDADRIQWQPEWRVPKSPSEHSKREAGHGYDGFPVDVVLWETSAGRGDPEELLAIIETKSPDIEVGRRQLEAYLSMEYTAKMGYWTNGASSIAVYKLPSGRFKAVRDAPLPKPSDSFTIDEGLLFTELVPPRADVLRAKLERVFTNVVARDTVSTRSDDRLNHLCNLLLVKLDSDKTGKAAPDQQVVFQPQTTELRTKELIQSEFKSLRRRSPAIFDSAGDEEVRLDAHSIHEVVYELAGVRLVDATPDTISQAFQVFRSANLKSGEGQYFTPYRVIQSAVEVMEVSYSDRVIDPACGTGGFLVEAYLSLLRRQSGKLSEADLRTWAHERLFGVDRDDINVKLAKAIMQIVGDGSANIFVGDSIRSHAWKNSYPALMTPLQDGGFSCAITNPPFGRGLKVSARDASRSGFTISAERKDVHVDLEIGLMFIERCWRLLEVGGRLGIVLPETYFFSESYKWLGDWLRDRFVLRGMFNIPMEAFQAFCRAKTNFYVFEKVA